MFDVSELLFVFMVSSLSVACSVWSVCVVVVRLLLIGCLGFVSDNVSREDI